MCPLCEREIAEPASRLHARCLARLPRTPPERRAVDVHACFEDGPGWFRLLHAWKYGGQRALARDVAGAMAPRMRAVAEDAVLVPVPDDPLRRLQRGYSPVGDLVHLLAENLSRKTDARLLRRRRAAPSQTSARDDAARHRNVCGLFAVGDLSRVAARRKLLLVDDQITSGATIRAAFRLLTVRGHRVEVWCAGRAARAPLRLA